MITFDHSARRTMPKQKPGNSKQDFGTPWEFIEAVEERFGKLSYDLAASKKNTKAPAFLTQQADSLSIDWHTLTNGWMWLNPPFAHIDPWARKCAREKRKGARIIFLTPASVGSNWFAKHVHGKALVIPVSPRLTFEGQPPNPKTGKVDPYPKDCMISVFAKDIPPGFQLWRWKE